MPEKTPKTLSRRVLLAGLAGLSLIPATSEAQQRRNRRNRRQRREDADSVRDAVRRGEIAPLRTLMRYFERQTGAEIIDVQYRNMGGRHLYGFKVRGRAGRLRWMVIDAATREIMTLRAARRRYGG